MAPLKMISLQSSLFMDFFSRLTLIDATFFASLSSLWSIIDLLALWTSTSVEGAGKSLSRRLKIYEFLDSIHCKRPNVIKTLLPKEDDYLGIKR